MAADATVETLQIQIEASSSDAAKKVNELAQALINLKGAAKGGAGLSSVTTELNKMKSAGLGMKSSLGGLKKVFGAVGFRQITKYLGSAVNSINEYVENVNLFQVSMGGFYQEASDYAELVSDRLGVDPSQWMRTQGVFMSMGKGFGMAEEQAYNLSESLTELSYDISSLYNEDIESAALRLQSALAGEIEPIRRLGISISQATLEEYALSKGINESVDSMTEQEKALLRSLKLIEGAADIGAIGDFAKTLESPANALRVLNAQITQFKRAIGSVMLPVIMQVLPYIQAFVSLLTDFISRLAVLVGFEMPEWDNNAWSTGFDGAADSVDDTTKAVKKLKNATIGLDELNIISQDSGGGAGAGGVSDWAKDIEIPDLWDKDALALIETQASEIKKRMEELLPLAVAIGAAFLAWKIGPSIVSGIKTLYESLGYLLGRFMIVSTEAEKLAGYLKFAGVVAVIATMVARFVDLYNNSELFRKGIERIGDVFSAVFTVAKDILSGVWTVLKDIGLAVIGILPDPVKNVILSGIKAIKNVVGLLDLDWKDLAITAAGFGLLFVPGGQVLGVALLAFEALTVGVRAFGLVSDETWEKVKTTVSEFWKQLKEEAKYAWDLFVSEFKESVNVVFSLETWKNLGQMAIDGLIAGLTNVGTKIKEFGENILDSVKDVLGIASPSKEFKAIGEYSVAGMQKGFDGLYLITDMFGNQLGVMKSYADNFSSETRVMIDTGLNSYLESLLSAKSNTQNATDSMTTMFRTMASNSNSAIASIISSLDSIPRNITTVHTIVSRSVSESAQSSVKAFADGGFPDHGQMFIARESGPELVGQIGSRTAVANNNQIVAAIEEAAYRGFIRANSESDRSSNPVVVENKVYLDGKQLRASFKKAEREAGASISSGGVLTR